ncbi:hypothetical protein MKW94_016919 [Papaver nudicaule]|uniref:Uncharacterized protein n=1 Tax=Papaver nudicaule TaxID=74823 RepID=A0AA41VHR5_PAPNU|nr:hypothetical protein [Papaver nudicaule]
MERYSIDATSNGNMSQRAMLNSSVAAGNNNNPSRPNYTCSYPLKPQSRDASFSSYLRPKDQKQEGNVADSELNIFEAERYFNDIQDQKELNKNVSSTGENLRNDDTPVANPRLSSVSSVDGASTNYGRNFRSGSFNATPTASSEASWNSQSGLLSNPPGSIAVSMRNLRLEEKKKMSRALSNSSSSSSSKWFFGRKCPCTGKKALQVEEDISEHNRSTQVVNLNNTTSFKKQSFSSAGEDVYIKATMEFEREKTQTIGGNNNWVKVQEVVPVKDSEHEFLPGKHWSRSFSNDTGGGGAAGVFSFPILNAPIVASKANYNGGKPVLMVQQFEDPPRESLEVFQPTEDPISLRKSTDLQRRVLMSCPEENDRRSFNYMGSPKIRPTDDDVVSDASSDLFEIESFSTQSTMFPMYRRRDSLDETSSFEGRRYGGIGTHFRRSLDEPATPSIAPTECYEPSEVSIDWSVTTAEGFDRGSVSNLSIAAPSDFEDVRFMNSIEAKMSNGTGGMSQTTSNRKGNGLFSCRYEKAVNVGPHPVKRVSLEQHHQVGAKYGLDSGRINAAMSTRMMDRNSLHKGNGNKQPFARSLSARMSYNQALTTRS